VKLVHQSVDREKSSGEQYSNSGWICLNLKAVNRHKIARTTGIFCDVEEHNYNFVRIWWSGNHA